MLQFLEYLSLFCESIKILEKLEAIIATITDSAENITDDIEILCNIARKIYEVSKTILNIMKNIFPNLQIRLPDISRIIPRPPIPPIEQEVCQKLNDGEFCYVLSDPATERETFVTNIQNEPEANAIQFGVIKCSKLKTKIALQDSWYITIINTINDEFSLECSANNWKIEHPDISFNLNCLEKYIESKLLTKYPGDKLVIIIDEIEELSQYDSLHQISLKNEFFRLVFDCYSKRSKEDQYKRLSFLMMGSASRNHSQPITVGYTTKLDNLLKPQVKLLVSQSQGSSNNINTKTIFLEIWKYTQYEPLLTQEIFQHILEKYGEIQEGKEIDFVKQEIHRLIKT